jgi:peptide/nickel transport system permease protein
MYEVDGIRARLQWKPPSIVEVARTAGSLPLVPVSILLVAGLTAVLAPVIAPEDPLRIDLGNRLQPPLGWGGDAEHPLGTDELGRDILSRLIFGSQVSLTVGIFALVIGAFIGTALGLVAAYFGGWIDALLMRAADMMLSFPLILVALLLAVILGPNTANVIIAVALILWTRFARVVRGEALSIREREYVLLAKIAGASPFRIMGRHILPNLANTVVVLASIQMGGVILTEASLSFLGAGIPPPAPTWGSMVSRGRDFVTTAWWLSAIPGLAIMLLVLSLNLMGDWLRDRLDPRLRPV